MYNKYHVSAKLDRTYDGIVFASKKEMHRYQELKLLEKAGEIKDLELQHPFILQRGFVRQGKKHQPIKYIADFVYFDPKESPLTTVEDVKGMKTAIYTIKKKLLLYKYPHIIFKEV